MGFALWMGAPARDKHADSARVMEEGGGGGLGEGGDGRGGGGMSLRAALC